MVSPVIPRASGSDGTTLRDGPAGQKKYVPGAFSEQHSLFFLGARSLHSFRDFAVLPDFASVVGAAADRDREVRLIDRWPLLRGCILAAAGRRPQAAKQA